MKKREASSEKLMYQIAQVGAANHPRNRAMASARALVVNDVSWGCLHQNRAGRQRHPCARMALRRAGQQEALGAAEGGAQGGGAAAPAAGQLREGQAQPRAGERGGAARRGRLVL
jgi:hypothetical protein